MIIPCGSFRRNTDMLMKVCIFHFYIFSFRIRLFDFEIATAFQMNFNVYPPDDSFGKNVTFKMQVGPCNPGSIISASYFCQVYNRLCRKTVFLVTARREYQQAQIKEKCHTPYESLIHN